MEELLLFALLGPSSRLPLPAGAAAQDSQVYTCWSEGWSHILSHRSLLPDYSLSSLACATEGSAGCSSAHCRLDFLSRSVQPVTHSR